MKAQDKKTIIFCNKIKSAQAVDYALRENNFSIASYYSEMPPDLKAIEFEKFMHDEVKIFVTTDIASRGLDFRNVEHVIIFDFPDNIIDYIHRIGRTGRMGRPGKATSLLQKKDLVLAEAIQNAIRRNETLEGITTDKKTNEELRKQKFEERRARLKRSSSKKAMKLSATIGKKRMLAKKRQRKDRITVKSKDTSVFPAHRDMHKSTVVPQTEKA